jgi:hypothetical protein
MVQLFVPDTIANLLPRLFGSIHLLEWFQIAAVTIETYLAELQQINDSHVLILGIIARGRRSPPCDRDVSVKDIGLKYADNIEISRYLESEAQIA